MSATRRTNRADDFLEEVIRERSKKNSAFPALVERALERRRFLRELASKREELGLSQTVVAARMGTSQSAVARLESGEIDARLSSLERMAGALGHQIEWRLVKDKRVKATRK